MAELVLTRVGAAVGGKVFGGALRALGAVAGARIDNALFGADRERVVEGPRLTALHLQASTEGASIPATYGAVRIAGQMIWTARFKEHVNVARSVSAPAGGKGFGAPKTTTTETTYTYSLSFAVGLCEGPALRVARAWANGEPLDLSTLNYRFHSGAEDQAADPLIEAIEGADNAPAYRGLCYILFEDLPLGAFGNVAPQLSFEIVRRPPAPGGQRLEELARGVCLIPGAGEFVYATDVVRRTLGPGAEIAENMHAESERANFRVSLDQLAQDLPNCSAVMLVVAWFGTDLRCGVCEIKPGVELADKTTRPMIWRAGGVERDGAHVISTHDGGPAYGGTPADSSIIQAIQDLKARGYEVGLYPFILMDVPAGNALPDPHGASAQAAYPWRGRITCTPAPGEPGTADKTAAAAAQAASFFGAAEAADFAIDGGEVSYSGPNEWSFRRFILHCANLAKAAGGVDAFVLGSELRGLTTVRGAANTFPAVAALQTLANDVRGVLDDYPGEPAETRTKLTYAADWSEYNGHQPQDGSGDVFFHLDPLWAESAIDCVGVDWYAPLSDWRDGAAHADAEIADGPHDPAYLESRIEAGEAFDFYYADDAARQAQTRAPITDGAYGKPWVFRAKDLRSWWSNPHYDRPGGAESGAATAWVPQSKPIWLIEFGCPAIDKGANAPNLFIDPKSAESALPPFSSGAPDDVIQRRLLEAYLNYWSGAANPVSPLYGGPMIDVGHSFLWCWDARPFPHFPARNDVWSDGANWRLGHWLNGRLGAANLPDVVTDLCARAGLEDADAAALTGVVSGYVVDAPASARAAIEPLMAVYNFDAAEEEGRIVFRHLDETPAVSLSLDDLVQDEDGRLGVTRADGADAPQEARVRFIDAMRDHQVAMVSARRRDAAGRGVSSIDAPLSLTADAAAGIAEHMLALAQARVETAEITLAPSHLALSPGDRIVLDGAPLRILSITEGPARRATLTRDIAPPAKAMALGDVAPPATTATPSAPDFALLDLPPLPEVEDDARPFAACAATPWPGTIDIYAGATLRARAATPAIMGRLEWALWPGPLWRFDRGNYFQARLSGDLASVDDAALLNGANSFAIENAAGAWEIIQARDITLISPGLYELRTLLRGQAGTEDAMGAPAGARIVALDGRLARAAINAHETGAELDWAAVASPRAPNDVAATSTAFTYQKIWARPFSPVHVRGARDGGGDVAVSWVRRARQGGDDWAALDVPLGEEREAYLVEVMSGPGVIRAVETDSPAWTYPAADQTADFGAPPASLTLRIAQISSGWGPGARAESTIWL